jgi:hypothetical protein
VLKIERSANGGIVFRVSGRIELDDITELRRLLALEDVDHHLALDLGDVTLVNRDAVTFLARCEEDGIKLRNCPPYVRKWLEKERGENP